MYRLQGVDLYGLVILTGGDTAGQQDRTEAQDEYAPPQAEGATILIKQVQHNTYPPIGDESIDEVAKCSAQPHEHPLLPPCPRRLTQTE